MYSLTFENVYGTDFGVSVSMSKKRGRAGFFFVIVSFSVTFFLVLPFFLCIAASNFFCLLWSQVRKSAPVCADTQVLKEKKAFLCVLFPVCSEVKHLTGVRASVCSRHTNSRTLSHVLYYTHYYTLLYTLPHILQHTLLHIATHMTTHIATHIFIHITTHITTHIISHILIHFAHTLQHTLLQKWKNKLLHTFLYTCTRRLPHTRLPHAFLYTVGSPCTHILSAYTPRGVCVVIVYVIVCGFNSYSLSCVCMHVCLCVCVSVCVCVNVCGLN